MSAGGTVAFAMELQEKGIWESGLHFGKTDNLAQVFEDIAYRRVSAITWPKARASCRGSLAEKSTPSTSKDLNWRL